MLFPFVSLAEAFEENPVEFVKVCLNFIGLLPAKVFRAQFANFKFYTTDQSPVAPDLILQYLLGLITLRNYPGFFVLTPTIIQTLSKFRDEVG